MNSVDPHHRLRANDAEPVADSWYINTYAPHTSWSKEVIFRGFDLTPDEYIAANSLLMTLLKTNDLFELKGTGQERIVKLWPVIAKFEAECGFWGKGETSYGVEIPGWWKRGALNGWIELAAQYMRKMRLPPLLPDPTPYRVWDPPPTERGPTLSPMVKGRAMDICGEGCESGNSKCLRHGVKIEPLEMRPGLWNLDCKEAVH
ncbi:hypothetical protein BGZ57DRAFT_994784 [Hyaloscypha finlandica]|nr:hypothetical protein BGZ57DRAFT_994784 [Hyaloscypha finlandica]KAH8786719.1 hypothetical protein F5882DRAFT_461822 [Hyaloscypha sp. PMI_1271]